ncbi:MAG: polysaccharide biosynthesis protein [Bryobacteraceae bacterium]|nr:polysaccharide biosynthesis protein [Bryobacteraceae bacterium]
MSSNGFAGKVLTITGGTGTFGNAVLQRFLRTEIREIRVVSRDEKKQDEMRNLLRSRQVKFYIGDVREPGSLAGALRGADYVFHAAALKQVPSCEFFPMEALRTNALGAWNVMTVAQEVGVKKLIVLSTDKAVYPVNAMGISKAMMEKMMVAMARGSQRGGTVFCGTRYGNVMASRGSVIPLFISQMEAGRPVTVTDPEMTRFMMTIEDAVDLVLYAFAHGDPGDIFVQKAPAATIGVLARALKELLGSESEIRVIGTRHGEKKYETLLNRAEMASAEDMGAYFRVPADLRELAYDSYFTEGEAKVSEAEEYNSDNTARLDVGGMMELLMKLGVVREAMERAGSVAR